MAILMSEYTVFCALLAVHTASGVGMGLAADYCFWARGRLSSLSPSSSPSGKHSPSHWRLQRQQGLPWGQGCA